MLLLTGHAKLLLTPWSQHQTTPLAIPCALLHRSHLVAGGREGHQSPWHKSCARAAMEQLPDPLPCSHPEGPHCHHLESFEGAFWLISPGRECGPERSLGRAWGWWWWCCRARWSADARSPLSLSGKSHTTALPPESNIAEGCQSPATFL